MAFNLPSLQRILRLKCPDDLNRVSKVWTPLHYGLGRRVHHGKVEVGKFLGRKPQDIAIKLPRRRMRGASFPLDEPFCTIELRVLVSKRVSFRLYLYLSPSLPLSLSPSPPPPLSLSPTCYSRIVLRRAGSQNALNAEERGGDSVPCPARGVEPLTKRRAQRWIDTMQPRPVLDVVPVVEAVSRSVLTSSNEERATCPSPLLSALLSALLSS